MKRTHDTLYSRRETLVNALKGIFATVSVAASSIAHGGATVTNTTSEREFIPENDYPFFGWHPENSPTKPSR